MKAVPAIQPLLVVIAVGSVGDRGEGEGGWWIRQRARSATTTQCEDEMECRAALESIVGCSFVVDPFAEYVSRGSEVVNLGVSMAG